MGSILVALLLSAPAQDAPAPTTTTLPVSLDRIRRGLQQKPALRVSAPPEPTFKVQVIQHPYFFDIPYTWTFGAGGVPSTAPSPVYTGGNPTTPPLVKAEAWPLVTAAKQALAEHAAQRDVQQAMLEFCAQYSCVLR